jgi:hypothetical protein
MQWGNEYPADADGFSGFAWWETIGPNNSGPITVDVCDSTFLSGLSENRARDSAICLHMSGQSRLTKRLDKRAKGSLEVNVKRNLVKEVKEISA